MQSDWSRSDPKPHPERLLRLVGSNTDSDLQKKNLREGRLPQDWLSATVTAIFKKGARHETSNSDQFRSHR